jgi:hypothetical protein
MQAHSSSGSRTRVKYSDQALIEMMSSKRPKPGNYGRACARKRLVWRPHKKQMSWCQRAVCYSRKLDKLCCIAAAAVTLLQYWLILEYYLLPSLLPLPCFYCHVTVTVTH